MAPGCDQGVEHLEDGALVGGRECFHLLEPLAEPGGLPGELLGERLEAEQLVSSLGPAEYGTPP